jgi:hypothetical protein
LVTCLWLVKNGVPFDVAFSLDETDRLAYAIILGKFEGGEWDFSRMRWAERK